MSERCINQSPVTYPQAVTWPTTQACALTGIELVTVWFAGGQSIHSATAAGAQI